MHTRRVRYPVIRSLLTLWLLSFAGIATADGAPAAAFASEPGLLDLMQRRLELMPAVAAFKWHHRQPVQDPEREAVVLADVRELALQHGLMPDSVERLFAVQMAAAREIQSWWIAEWTTGRAAAPPAPDLAGQIRPELSRIGAQIVAAAARFARSQPFPGFAECPGHPVDADCFDLPGLDRERQRALLDAAAAVAAFPDRLAQIRATGRLRIGTTGDYAPFSHRAGEALEFVGIDIDLGRDLAHALGVEPEYVLTSWPTLLDDLRTGRFDIAMSGVSRTVERAREGFLSDPYYADGKTPIARCADRDRFATLEAIDRTGVRVVVNPGGTNERFVDERLRQATKLVHPDNRTIFEELRTGRADVMFTDRIEVVLQTRRHPDLCGTMADNLTYQEKAFLLPQDAVWLRFVDTWLGLRLAEGRVDQIFAAHGFRRLAPRGPAGASEAAGVSLRTTN